MPASIPNIKLKELLEDEEERRLVLPNFQRDFIWERKQQQKLLASFLVELPIGNILRVEGDPDDFASRQLCFPKEVIPEKHCSYLLDGQQRISTLKTILDDVFDRDKHKSQWDEIYEKLKWRWFIKLEPGENESLDPFGWNDLIFKDPTRFEPGDVKSFVKAKRIYKHKDDQWYQPNFTPEDEDGKELSKSDRRIQVSRRCARKGLIPLWEIYKFHDKKKSLKRKSIHHRSIKYISNRRVDIIRGRVESESNKSISPKDIFKDINEEVIKEYEEGNDDSGVIDSAWDDLKSDWKSDVKGFLDDLVRNEIVQIRLPDDEIHRAIALFEYINTSGTDLDTYDLVVAKAARDKEVKNLSRRILSYLETPFKISKAVRSKVKGDVPSTFMPSKLGTVSSKIGQAPSKYFKEQFLNLLSIYCHCGHQTENIRVRHTKRREQLNLDYGEINENTHKVASALIRAITFLYLRCGLLDIGNQEYNLMTLPISYVFLSDENWKSEEVVDKLESWYWASLFGGYYRENQNEVCIDDLKNLKRWVDGHENPFENRYDSILEDDDYSDVVTLLGQNEEYSTKKAIRNGLVNYVLSNQPFDLREGDKKRLYSWMSKIEDGYDVEKHHIIPIALVSDSEDTDNIRDDDDHILNSPLNITPVSSEANKELSAYSPVESLDALGALHTSGHSLPPPTDFEQIGLDAETEDIEDVLMSRYSNLKQDITGEAVDLSGD